MVKIIWCVTSEFSLVDAQPGFTTHHTEKHRVAVVGSVTVSESEYNSGQYGPQHSSNQRFGAKTSEAEVFTKPRHIWKTRSCLRFVSVYVNMLSGEVNLKPQLAELVQAPSQTQSHFQCLPQFPLYSHQGQHQPRPQQRNKKGCCAVYRVTHCLRLHSNPTDIIQFFEICTRSSGHLMDHSAHRH